MKVTAYFTTPEMPQGVKTERKAKREHDIVFIGIGVADFAIQEMNCGVKEYAYMRDNATGKARFYSQKEFEALKNAGKNIVTDF